MEDREIVLRDNIEMQDDKKRVLVHINPKIYSMDVIFSAAYVFIDRAYVVIDGDPEKIVTVLLRSKDDEDLEKLARDFNEELINYSFYKEKANVNMPLRAAIVQKALEIHILEVEKDGTSGDKEQKNSDKS